jgi:hypothetical protein
MPASCRCGRQWTGLSQAHCATCHQHFSSVANFDRRRPGTTGCQDSATVTKRNGEPVFKPSVNRFGTTWVGAGEYAGPGNDADPAIAISA